MKKVGVVVLNYKLKDQVIKCCQSLYNSSYTNLAVYVVDNNSQDGVGQALKIFPKIIFIQNGVNSGYTGGNNLGIKQALKDDCDYVFVLNPDTIVVKDTISQLIKQMELEDAQLAGPKIYFADSKIIWFAGGIFDFRNVLGSHRGVDEKDHGQYDQVYEPDYLTGAALMVKREVFEKIGLFDERYYLYYEDADFSYRAKEAGFKLTYLPKAIVYHKNAQTTGLGSPLQDYFITRNRLLFAGKFLSVRTKFALLREALRNCKMKYRRLALYDFLMGNFGRGSFK